MDIKVFKFGGASIRDKERIENIANILESRKDQKILIVMSAMGKSTNQLEAILKAHAANDVDQSRSLFEQFKSAHYEVLAELLDQEKLNEAQTDLNDTLVEIEWILEEAFEDNYDYLYDQMVSVGELVSTKLVYHYLSSKGFNICWYDVRNAMITDNTYREAKVDWKTAEARISKQIPEQMRNCDFVLTQGFIGSTTENFTTTLGREGSDYTAAIFAYCLNSEELTIWKDVEGILTGDPRKNNHVHLMQEMSFREAVEMTYYGAKVLHPKTIKPLQNKNIKLNVRSFINLENPGTQIGANNLVSYPPITVIEENQILLKITTKDFSFIAEDHLNHIFKLVSENRIKVRLMKNSALSFDLCILNPENRFDQFLTSLKTSFDVELIKDLNLITIRHYNQATIDEKLDGREVVFSERDEHTVQLLVR